jgi:DNA-binding MarR family transcriptional regulator
MRTIRDTAGIASDIRRWMEAFTMRSMHEWMRHVKAAGHSMPQVGILMFLYHGGGRTVHDIGVHAGISNPAASMLVERLVRAGLVERSEQPGDRRVRRVVLSVKGRSFIERSLRERDAWVDDLAARLSAREAAALRSAIPVLIEAERRLGAVPPPHWHPVASGARHPSERTKGGPRSSVPRRRDAC